MLRPVLLGSLLGLALGTAGNHVKAQEVPRYQLELSKETPFAGLGPTSTLGPTLCDAKGNIYLRFPGALQLRAPINKFTAEGEKKAVFSTDSVQGWESADILSYTVAPDSQVYLLVSNFTKDQKYEFGVLSFGDDGHHRFSTEIKTSLESVNHLAVFSTGQFFIAGYRKAEETPQQIPGTPSSEARKEPLVEPVILVVDGNGNLIKEVTLFLGTAIRSVKDSVAPLQVRARAVHLGSVVAGEDGNIYLMLQASKPTVYAISAGGQVVRVFEVDPPGEKSEAIHMIAAPPVGLLLVTGEREVVPGGGRFPLHKMFFSLVDPQTGERLYDYQTNQSVGGGLACYTPQGMLFFGVSNGKFVLRKASFR